MSENAFDYKIFSQDLAKSKKKQTPKNFTKSQKEYVYKTTLNFTYLAGEALCSNQDRFVLSSSQISFITKTVGEFIFQKACCLISDGIDEQNFDSILQQVAFHVFEKTKLCVLDKTKETEITNQIEQLAQNVYEKAVQSNTLAFDYYDENYEKKLDELNKLIEKNPNCIKYYQERLSIYSAMSNAHEKEILELRINDYQKLLKLDKENAFEYCCNLSMYYFFLEKQDETMDYANQAYKLAKTDNEKTAALEQRVNNLLEQKRYEEAIEDYNELIKLNKEYQTSYLSERANCYALIGNFDKAIEETKKLIGKETTHLYFTLGNYYEKAGNYKKALKAYETYNKYNKTSYNYQVTANCALKAGNIKYAIDLCSQGIQEFNDKSLYAVRAIYYFDNKQYKEFKQEYSNLLKDTPDFSLIKGCVYFCYENNFIDILSRIIEFLKNQSRTQKLLAHFLKERALYNFSKKNYKAAIEDCDESIEFDDSCEDSYTTKINSLLELNRVNEAKKLSDLRTEFILNNSEKFTDSQTQSNYLARIDCLYKSEKYDDAILLFSKLKHSYPLNSAIETLTFMLIHKYKEIDLEFAQRLEKIDDEAENPETVLHRINEMIEENPGNAQNYIKRAEYHIKENYDWKKAIKDYSKAIELDPNNAKYYKERSFCYSMSDQTQKAIKDMSKAIELEPENKDFYITRANLYSSLKTDKGNKLAIKDYQTALSISSIDEIYKNLCMSFIGDLYYKINEPNKAISYLQDRDITMNDVLLLAKAYKQTGQFEKAAECFEKCYKEAGDYIDYESDMLYSDIVKKELSDMLESNISTEIKENIQNILK